MTILYVLSAITLMWLAALTVAFVAIVRASAVTAIGRGLDTSMPAGLSGFSLDNDGPDVGSAIPDLVSSLLADLPVEPQNATIIMLSTTCGNCYERASEVLQLNPESYVFLVGGRTETVAAQELIELLRSNDAVYITGSSATSAAEALNISSVPFAVRYRDGFAADKIYLRAGEDIQVLNVSKTT